MKYLFSLILITSFTMMGNNPVEAQKEMDEFSIMVDGLGCPFCAYGLEKKFREFKGIRNVRIDMETGFFTFRYPAEKALGLTEVIGQVEVAGYTPMESKVNRADGSEEIEGVKEVEIAADAELVEAQFTVLGKCAMCRARVEKAAKQLPGVITADWEQDSQKMAIQFDKKQISQAEVEMAIARAGHDTESVKASDKVYKKLHGCCKYDRSAL